MSEAWLNFAIAFLVQLVFFIIHAAYEKKSSDIARILGQGVLSGIILGLLFDLVLGKFLTLWSYVIRFDTLFLIFNAILVYGLFAANTLLMQKVRLLHFFIWTMLMGAVLDISNIFFHVWTWGFPLFSIEFLAVFLIGNFGTAVLVAVVWHVFLGRRFFFIDSVSSVYYRIWMSLRIQREKRSHF